MLGGGGVVMMAARRNKLNFKVQGNKGYGKKENLINTKEKFTSLCASMYDVEKMNLNLKISIKISSWQKQFSFFSFLRFNKNCVLSEVFYYWASYTLLL